VNAPLQLLGFAGSLRKESLNRRLLLAAQELAPVGVQIDVAEYDDVPIYNGDLDTDERRPAAVQRLKDQVTTADGLVIATPEYNYGIPGPLKNVIDWISRPAYRSPFAGKAVAIMSASPSMIGGVRAQAHLKNVLLGMAARPFAFPEVAVVSAKGKFDDDRLVDEPTRDVLRQMLVAFAESLRGSTLG
jgi:chromate reductase